jgi:hypothetical protein
MSTTTLDRVFKIYIIEDGEEVFPPMNGRCTLTDFHKEKRGTLIPEHFSSTEEAELWLARSGAGSTSRDHKYVVLEMLRIARY